MRSTSKYDNVPLKSLLYGLSAYMVLMIGLSIVYGLVIYLVISARQTAPLWVEHLIDAFICLLIGSLVVKVLGKYVELRLGRWD